MPSASSREGCTTDSGGLISNKFAIVSEQPPSALTGASTVIAQHGTYGVDQSTGTGQNVFDKSTGTWASAANYTGSSNVYDGVAEHHSNGQLGDWIELTRAEGSTKGAVKVHVAAIHMDPLARGVAGGGRQQKHNRIGEFFRR